MKLARVPSDSEAMLAQYLTSRFVFLHVQPIIRTLVLCLFLWGALSGGAAINGIQTVKATERELQITLATGVNGRELVEFTPEQTFTNSGKTVMGLGLSTASTVAIPRFDGPRDRL